MIYNYYFTYKVWKSKEKDLYSSETAFEKHLLIKNVYSVMVRTITYNRSVYLFEGERKFSGR